MKNNLILFFVFVSQFQFVIAQSSVEKRITGQVTRNGVSSVGGVNITNTSNKRRVVSDEYGHFSILVKEGDILSFSDVSYEFLRKFINHNEFNLGNIVVDLTPINIQLEEVIVNKHSNITAENLGIIPKDQVKLTTAERRLQTAGEFKPIQLLGLLGGSMPLDPVINAISGRTKALKKDLAIERKELMMVKLEHLFEDKYYLETLKISEEFIKGFQYYCIEDFYFVQSLKDNNKRMSMFLIVGLASEFKKNQEN